MYRTTYVGPLRSAPGVTRAYSPMLVRCILLDCVMFKSFDGAEKLPKLTFSSFGACTTGSDHHAFALGEDVASCGKTGHYMHQHFILRANCVASFPRSAAFSFVAGWISRSLEQRGTDKGAHVARKKRGCQWRFVFYPCLAHLSNFSTQCPVRGKLGLIPMVHSAHRSSSRIRKAGLSKSGLDFGNDSCPRSIRLREGDGEETLSGVCYARLISSRVEGRILELSDATTLTITIIVTVIIIVLSIAIVHPSVRDNYLHRRHRQDRLKRNQSGSRSPRAHDAVNSLAEKSYIFGGDIVCQHRPN